MKSDELENLSDSMEMYLVTIVRLREGGSPVPLSHLADALEVTSVSVNEMCRKLQDNGLLIYRPYKGALLTERGERLANHTLRRHRLWEVFLVDKLHLDEAQADDVACDLEHVATDEVIDRLDAFLDFPAVNPRGLPIPRSDRSDPQQVVLHLPELMAGTAGQVVECAASGPAREFLEGYGLRPGMKVTLIAKGRDNVLVEVDGVQVVLGHPLAQQVSLTPVFNEGAVDESPVQYTQQEVSDMTTQERDKTTTGAAVPVKQVPLSALEKGQEAIIVHVGGEGAIKRRMMDMGIVPGAAISMVRKAPFGDPVEYLVKGYSLSLRRSEAAEIMVELVKEAAE